LAIYTGLIEKVMAQSTPAECDALGAQMRRIEAAVSNEAEAAAGGELE